MTYNEAETHFELIDPVLRAKGYRQWRIKLETPAPVEPIGPKGRRRAGSGRTDYLDLKAANPCVHLERDTRSPQEILEAIAARGRVVEAAIDRLRALMDNPSMRISEEESV